jgi:3-isopropylmalate/(R)-2-methylmalate dehydratase small subunit
MHRITKVTGRAIPMRGNDIDTDRIVPARFLRAITFDGMEAHLFEDDRKMGGPGHNRHPFDVPAYQGASILLVNSNFGCGSSREHAPQAIRRWGIEAIVGESFAEIFFGNSAMIGMPCVTGSSADVKALQDLVERNPRTEIGIDLIEGTCKAGDFRCPISLAPNSRDAFATGAWDTTGLLLDRYEDVDATSARLPYIAGF